MKSTRLHFAADGDMEELLVTAIAQQVAGPLVRSGAVPFKRKLVREEDPARRCCAVTAGERVAFSRYLATALVVQGTMNPDVFFDSSDEDSDDPDDDFSPQEFMRDSVRDLVAVLMTAATYYLVLPRTESLLAPLDRTPVRVDDFDGAECRDSFRFDAPALSPRHQRTGYTFQDLMGPARWTYSVLRRRGCVSCNPGVHGDWSPQPRLQGTIPYGGVRHQPGPKWYDHVA